MAIYVQKVLIAVGIVLGAVLVPLAVYFVFPHFVPFLAAYLFALLLEPVNKWLLKKVKVRRGIIASVTYFSFVGVIGLISYFIATKIITEMFDLIRNIQNNIPEIQGFFYNLYAQGQDLLRVMPAEVADPVNQSFIKFLNELASLNLITTIGAHTYNLTRAVPNLFIVLLVFLISIYLFSINLGFIKERFFSYFKDNSRAKLNVVLKELRTATVGFAQAQIILSTVTYTISLIGLLILGISYPLAVALLIVVVDILPILGTGSVIIPWAVYSFIRGRAFEGFGLIILFLIITVVRRIIEPKILGEKIGLGALSTLISIWVGFKVLGIVGVFLGPLLVILFKALIKAGVITYKFRV